MKRSRGEIFGSALLAALVVVSSGVCDCGLDDRSRFKVGAGKRELRSSLPKEIKSGNTLR